MTFRLPQPLLPQGFAWFDPATGKPTMPFYQYQRDVDVLVREYAAEIIPVTVALLPTNATPGQRRYASDGRKAGEGAGNGTGVLVFYDEGGDWIAVDTGATVAA